MLGETYLLDEVQVGVEDVLWLLIIEDTQQKADDALNDDRVALSLEVHVLTVKVGGDPHATLAPLDDIGRGLVALGEWL